MKIKLRNFRDKCEYAFQTYHYNRNVRHKGRGTSLKVFVQVLCLYFLDIRFIPRDLKKRLKEEIWAKHRRLNA